MSIDRDAEQATIGAILLDPARYEDVRDWLEPADFDGLREREVFTTIAKLAERHADPTPDNVLPELQANPSSSPLAPDGVFLADCVHGCPEPSRAAVYGRMVLEFSIRRTIAIGATKVRQAAEHGLEVGSMNHIFIRVDALRRDVEDLHQREARADEVLSPSPLQINRLPDVEPVSHLRDHDLENRVVRGLIETPAALATTSDWLRPSDFADDAASAVYRTLLEMRESGVRIDRLTVGWTLAHSDEGVAPLDGLLRRAEVVSKAPLDDARMLLHAAVLGRVVSTASELQAMRDDIRDSDVTAVVYRRLNDLWADQRRVVRATRA